MYIHKQKFINAILEYSINKKNYFAPQESQREAQTQSRSEEKERLTEKVAYLKLKWASFTVCSVHCCLRKSVEKKGRKEMHRILPRQSYGSDETTGSLERCTDWAKGPSVTNLG